MIGCGDVSRKYAATFARHPLVHVARCADLLPVRAGELAARTGAAPGTVDEILDDPGIELVVNLTPPQMHARVTERALRAGKSVYTEKPLAVDAPTGARLLAEATAAGLWLGCAPDTFLGPSARVVRGLIDDGEIGTPLGAAAAMLAAGHERSCATPDAFYQPGAGPMLDMGVYYVTMLVSLLGPVRRVTGMRASPAPLRTIDVGARAGATFESTVPTHVTGLLDFASGVTGTITASFDVWGSRTPPLEIYGTRGALVLPDPNFFRGRVQLRRAGQRRWIEVPVPQRWPAGRGIGVVDLAHAMRGRGPQRAGGALGRHVLEVMTGIVDADGTGRDIGSTCARPAPFHPMVSDDGCAWCETLG
ncbi:Gfo/Idh/MocA family protein [Phytohabitans rumicis]|uniref:Oxidoreductase n=1 Tax=Phytohabitans rumicis TaxID=1076125 RepID=A0A6V8LKZ9_9ACTN|nr:Gfo/Idh/MocA family oxidoreductase [Phytohabitans rumicis]GFJ95558.1 oxidoreductase [Phytohabitans rumicis]